MREARLNQVESWIIKMLQQVPDALLDNIIIFGSAAIALNGYYLQEPPKDLDLFVSPEVFSALQTLGFATFAKSDIVGMTLVKNEVEAFTDFNGIAYQQVKANSHILRQPKPVRYADIADIKAWKQIRNQPKDRLHLQEIEALANQSVRASSLISS